MTCRRYQCWYSDDCEGTAALEADERAQRAPRLLNHGVHLVAIFKAELHGRAHGVRRASLIFCANVAGLLGHTHRIRRVVVLDALISVYKAKSGPLKDAVAHEFCTRRVVQKNRESAVHSLKLTCCPTRCAYASMIFFILVVFFTLKTVSSPSATQGSDAKAIVASVPVTTTRKEQR